MVTKTVAMTIANRGDYSESVTIDELLITTFIMRASSLMKNVTQKYRYILGSHKTANRVSLNGHRGPKNKNHQKIYTYLNAAKAEDSGYTNF